MSNGERISFIAGESDNTTPDIPHDVAEVRGESVNQVELENRAKEEHIAGMDIQELMNYQPANEEERLAQVTALEKYLSEMPDEEPKSTEFSPKAKENLETAKKKPGFKKCVAIAVAAVMTAGAVGYAIGASGPQTSPSDPNPKTEEGYEQEENKAEQEGIKDGYGEKGMYLSENKPSKLAFASAVEVAEMFDGDECDMVKYTADNEVEAMAAYMAHIPEKLQPEGFKGLTIKQNEEKLESLSNDEYEKVQKQFNDVIDKALTRTVNVDGKYDNAYIDYKNNSDKAIHENMEAVKCVTDEHSKMREMYWVDDGFFGLGGGEEIGSMTLKIIVDEEGHIIDGCIQPLDPHGKTTIYTGTPERPTPDPDPDKTTAGGGKEGAGGGKENSGGDEGSKEGGDEGTEWGKSGDPHGGDKVDVSDPVDPNSEVSKDQNDSTNSGNRGYKDDNGAKPGSSSGSSSNKERISGGSNQGGGSTAGKNNAPSGNTKVDSGGNAAQSSAQSNTKVGGDNKSNTAEEKAVESGDF